MGSRLHAPVSQALLGVLLLSTCALPRGQARTPEVRFPDLIAQARRVLDVAVDAVTNENLVCTVKRTLRGGCCDGFAVVIGVPPWARGFARSWLSPGDAVVLGLDDSDALAFAAKPTAPGAETYRFAVASDYPADVTLGGVQDPGFALLHSGEMIASLQDALRPRYGRWARLQLGLQAQHAAERHDQVLVRITLMNASEQTARIGPGSVLLPECEAHFVLLPYEDANAWVRDLPLGEGGPSLPGKLWPAFHHAAPLRYEQPVDLPSALAPAAAVGEADRALDLAAGASLSGVIDVGRVLEDVWRGEPNAVAVAIVLRMAACPRQVPARAEPRMGQAEDAVPAWAESQWILVTRPGLDTAAPVPQK